MILHRLTGRFRLISINCLVSLLVVFLIWLCLGLTPKPLLVNRANGSYAITDQSGNLLRLSVNSDEKYRLWTPLTELPSSVLEATLHYEDRWFFYHPGINPIALFRAITTSLMPHQRWFGASTLTMQLARQRWRLKTDNITGKLKQMAYAIWLERYFSKNELLEAYLNLAPYGANIEGVGAAAWVYYHKPASALTADEARALVLIPQNPNQRAPITAGGQTRLRAAWQNTYPNDPGFERLWFRQRKDLPFKAAHFAERVHGLYPELATVSTTLDRTIQELSEQFVAGFLRQHRQIGISNATVMVLHAPSMAVLGYVGSGDYFNTAIQGYVNGLKAVRSPGSTLKPFIYGLAIAQGLITPDTLLKDTPLRIGDYQPENFERNFFGPLTATDALIRSRNIPAISLLAQLKHPTLHEFLQQASIAIPKQSANYGLSLAIGTAEISMEDLLRLYGVLANNGQLRPLQWLNDQKVVAQTPLVMLPEAALLVRQMLESNPRPQQSFGAHNFVNQQAVAWKTGTSSGLKDAWAIGLGGDLIVGVWVGNFDARPNRHLVGRELAGPLLFNILDAIAMEHQTARPSSSPPDNLKRIEICPLSGMPISPWCPHGKFGWIIPGVSPIKTCTIHRQIKINPKTGLRLCPDDKTPGTNHVAEFWDGDELQLFQQAGVKRDPPPAYDKACAESNVSESIKNAPKIVSPHPRTSYPIRAGAKNTIEFSAITSGGSQRLFWFVDDNFVGEGATVIWLGKPGQFTVTVVDDQGLSAISTLNVLAVGE